MTQSTSPANRINVPLLLGLFGFILLIAAASAWYVQQNATASPKEDSAEVGFARDMIVHHTQAVEMAIILYDRTENPTLKSIALDIILTQQAQNGQMQGWLALWEVPYASSDLPMTWMGMPTEGLMPGMATEAQMAALREAEGVEGDLMFLELMIAHHRSGIHMAESVLDKTNIPAVESLARSIKEAQEREITDMENLAASLES